MNIAREFVGGPFDGELIALSEEKRLVRVPLPRQWRTNPRVAETAAYHIDQDHMQFTARSQAPDSLLTDSQV